jgi:hypothetical protein
MVSMSASALRAKTAALRKILSARPSPAPSPTVSSSLST